MTDGPEPTAAPTGRSRHQVARPRRRLAAMLAVGLVPWVVVAPVGGPTTATVVFAYGLVTPSPLHVTTVWTYLLVLTGGLPGSLLAWPVASLLYALAVVAAGAGVATGREDRRLTAGLLVLAGASLLPVAATVGRPPGVLALPVGTAACWLVAWLADGDALAQLVREGGAGPS